MYRLCIPCEIMVRNNLKCCLTNPTIHDGGVARPSGEDSAATDRARTALETIGVALADHIIVADGDFVSLAESGYLERGL